MKTITKPFLTKIIRVCDRCGKVDIKTYARYKLSGKNYILDSAYSRCQDCERTKEFTEEEIKKELSDK